MITVQNFSKLLQTIGFQENNQVFEKYFPQTEAYLKVDFQKQELIYPKEIKIWGEFTTNFSANENFVVFECVHRLLEKGYLPKHIELEPKIKSGHGASGGRADILVQNQEEKPLLLIECKTAGKEFSKAWKYMLIDGGQLLNYVDQINRDIEFLCLYASDFDEKENKINVEQKIVSHKDNHKILIENSQLKSFKEVADAKERYKVWKDTYKLEYTEMGIFEKNIQAYSIGKENYTLDDLYIVSEKDIQKKYNEFATILRQYNISGRENAFDKLVNLFLAKIVDEKHNPTHLQFRWRGIAADDYFSFIDRLEKLYANGMAEFLKEEVTYVEKETIISAFKFFRNDPDATRETVLNHFKRQKYFTNNDFSFIDVHNEKLFYQNVVVLRKIVQMIENIQLNGDQQNQFLGDLFEGFLDKGVKQSEGQFFTPMPIVKFILMSLPLENLIKNSQEIPKAIDYACGAGHFLTELAAQIKPLVQQYKTEVTPKDYYRNIYGIEKEYRLSKVAKVSAFMYSQDDIQIFYADALTTHPEIREESFDILVANPPFAVKGFLETLDEEERKRFALTQTVSDLPKNNNIQCFFLERAKQLLKVGGIMGIIVPSSVLSNSDTTHIATREMLLQNFDFIALTEFGSKTFGATGTNTVVLFLRKKDNNPPPHIHYKERVDSWFSKNDEQKQQIYEDRHFIHLYCQYLDIRTEDYLPLLQAFNDLDVINGLFEYDMFKEYRADFQKTADKIKEKHRKEIERFPKVRKTQLLKEQPELSVAEIEEKIKTEVEALAQTHRQELDRALIEHIQKIEIDKLYYFVLASTNPQKVLIVKSPADSTERKKFLGYDWSGAKGKEGIKYLVSQTATDETEDEDKRIVENMQAKRVINTPLFDNNWLQNPDKIAYYIQQNFILEKKYYINEKKEKVRDYWNEKTEPLTLHEPLQKFVSYANVVDLLDFSRKDFNKALSLTPKKKVEVETKWELVKIEDLCEIGRGRVINHQYIEENQGDYPVYSSQTQNEGIMGYINTFDFEGEYVTWTTDGIYAGTCFYRKGKFNCTNVCGTLKIKNEKVLTKFLPLVLNDITPNHVVKSANPKLMNNVMGNIKIPLPHLPIQEKIVSECERIDKATENAKIAVEKVKREMSVLFSTNNFPIEKLGKIAKKVTENIEPQNESGEVIYIGLENIESQTGTLVGNVKTQYSEIKSTKTRFQENDVLYGKLRPNLNKVYLAKEKGICSTDILVFRFENEKLAKYYAHYFLTSVFNEEVLKTVSGQQLPRTSWTDMQELKIPVPPLATQEKLISEIEILEKQIAENELIIKKSANEKQAVLKNYL